MNRHTLFFVLFFALASTANAALCPDLISIQAGNFQGWLPLYSADDEPASPDQIQEFRNSVHSFMGAAWNEDFLNGQGRCVYDSDVEIMLAKDTATPFVKTGKWQNVSGTYGCNSHMFSECPFPDQANPLLHK